MALLMDTLVEMKRLPEMTTTSSSSFSTQTWNSSHQGDTSNDHLSVKKDHQSSIARPVNVNNTESDQTAATEADGAPPPPNTNKLVKLSKYGNATLLETPYTPSARVSALVRAFPNCSGSERIIEMLLGSGVPVTADTCQSLPKMSTIEKFYGKGPLIYGMETCQAYQKLISAEENNGNALKPLPKVAGLYSSGTNALARLAQLNLGTLPHIPGDGHDSAYYVPVREVFVSRTKLLCGILR